jgi:hypothetical protein
MAPRDVPAMPSLRRTALLAVVTLAALAAFLPRFPATVERLYSAGVYPAVQAALTTASNSLPFAVFDLGLVVAIGLLLWWWGRGVLDLSRRRGGRAIGRAVMSTAALAAAAYLWFLLAWGLNYSRPPLEFRLALPRVVLTERDIEALLAQAVAESNALYHEAHRVGGLGPDALDTDVATALHAVEARQGRPRPTVPGLPKPTLLASYFRMAGVDGLTAPLALETLLNPDLVAVERPFTLAHEWAHLAGYAPEADANFVAWLVTQEPGTQALTRYSGWLFLLSEASRQVPAEARRLALATLDSGPRQDLADIARRLQRRVDLVERVGWRVYDSYLKSQGVPEGVRSYSRVVELIVRARRRDGVAAAPAPAAVPQ